MLNETMHIEKKEIQDFKPIPPDVYTVELLDINSREVETYDSKKNRKENDTIAPLMETILDFQFVLLEGVDMASGEQLRGRNVFQNYVPSVLYISTKNGKNKLYQIVEALQKAPLSPEQEAYGITGKDLNALIGKQCRVGTVINTKGDKSYTNIDKFLPAKESFPALTVEEKENARLKPKDDKEDNLEVLSPF